MTSICEHLGISRPTYYRYIAVSKTCEAAPKTTQIQL
ncbi:MAG: helix-turn-helix domain-containing protein [Phormidesmis sp. CAN_BIN44]|nr:helix-turn-helix domain-containing protein [Phormidesmis sp. CAN_BIN44]